MNTISSVFALTLFSFGLFEIRALDKNELMERTREARKITGQLCDVERLHLESHGKFIEVPPNVPEIPKATCASISRIPVDWPGYNKKANIGPDKFKEVNGEPCFRYRYRVIVCPQATECADPEFKKKYEYPAGSTIYGVIRAEGDLDGDGVFSRFERLLWLQGTTGSIGDCHVFSEKELE